MLNTTYELVSNGVSLASVGYWGDVIRRDRAQGGNWELSWRMDLKPGLNDRALRRGSLVELRMAGVPLWAGQMAEPDRAEGEFVARGLSRLAEDHLALTSGGLTTSTPNTAIDTAIAAGLPWRRPNNVSAMAVTTGDTTEGVNYLHTLLDAFADTNGSQWGVNAGRVVYGQLPTTLGRPVWFCTPGSAYLGISDEDFATHLVGRYRDSTTTFATTTVGDANAAQRWGYRAVPVDLTARGVITLSTAQTHLANLLAKIGPRPGWANGVEVTPNEITTAGGVPANLGLIRGGDIVRLYGVFDENLRPIPHIDFTIGELTHDVGGDSIRLEPLGMADRNLAAIIESAGNPTSYKG